MGKIVRRCLLHETSTQLIGNTNPPRCSRRYLFSSDETIIQPAMNSGSVDAQDLRCLSNRYNLPRGWLCWRFVARNVAIATQTADLIRREAFTVCSFAPLAIKNASDDVVRIVNGQTTE